ncbi:guanylate kinase [Novisyntrophococcus fermenticellae]|uniref:guanylate kinase n=1 Tax=Novisyntrophococcus fermenticellae TaxID=2068655 RepID=UPI001E5DBCE6|nr:guanylate kinase [Novisyntrophococcus fermenticellae]
MFNKGILVVVSGFSGAGKGTVIKKLLSMYNNYALSISATTRRPRDGEQDGVHYFFKSISEFKQMISEDSFIEYAKYVDNYYGTPKAYVEEQLNAGKDVILEIEIQGALHVKEQFPDALLLFITPPSAGALVSRLKGRGTETTDQIQGRLHRAAEESEEMERYDYIVINDEIDACVSNIHQIIQIQHETSRHQSQFITRIQDELKREDF